MRETGLQEAARPPIPGHGGCEVDQEPTQARFKVLGARSLEACEEGEDGRCGKATYRGGGANGVDHRSLQEARWKCCDLQHEASHRDRNTVSDD